MTDRPARPLLPSRRQVVLGGALLATAGIAYARTPYRRLTVIGKGELEKVIPLTIGEWSYETQSGLVLPPPDELAAQLYDQTITRVYNSSTSLPIMLLIAYGSSETGMLQVHRPETCYPAGGYKLSDSIETTIPLPGGRQIPSRFFSATGSDRVEQLIYWIRIGGDFPQRWIEQREAVFRQNLQGLIPDGLLVRISAITTDRAAAEATVKRFAATMIEAAPAAGKRLLLG